MVKIILQCLEGKQWKLSSMGDWGSQSCLHGITTVGLVLPSKILEMDEEAFAIHYKSFINGDSNLGPLRDDLIGFYHYLQILQRIIIWRIGRSPILHICVADANLPSYSENECLIRMKQCLTPKFWYLKINNMRPLLCMFIGIGNELLTSRLGEILFVQLCPYESWTRVNGRAL